MNRVSLSAFAAALLLAYPATSFTRDSPPGEAAWSRAVNLMPLIDLEKDAVKGTWKLDHGTLISGMERGERIQIPYEPPDEYDYRIVFSITGGATEVMQIFSHAGRMSGWAMGAVNNTLIGFQMLGGKAIRDNPTTLKSSNSLDKGQTYTSVLSIRRRHLKAYLNGKQLAEWKGGYDDAGMNTGWDLPNHHLLGFGTYASQVEFRRIELLEITGKGKAVRLTESSVAQTTNNDAASSNVINLMPLIDPAKDAVDGKWAVQDGKLVSELGGRSRLMIPYEPPDEYDYRIILSRRQGTGYAIQYLPRNEHAALWIIGNKDDTLYGFEMVGGKGIYAANNPTVKGATIGFASGRSFTSLVKVRKSGLKAFMDGKQITEWKTDFNDASISPYWELPNRQLLGIGNYRASFVFEKIEIVEITGKGKPLRESAGPSPEQPQPVGANTQPNARKETGKFVRNQSSIKALYVIETRAGMRAGSAQDVIATVERGGSSRDKVCDFVADVEKDTRISMQEAERLLKLRYPTWEWGCKVRFSYANKYTKQAGGSAGGAFSVLLLSLLDGMQIDPGYAMTGDVTVDGKIREVGAVAEKIRGAVLEGCKVIAVPDTNKEDLNDLAVLYSPAMLWSAQIFSIATLDDAAAVARVDRATNLANAVSLFAEVQSRLGKNTGAAALRNPWVYQSLREVLRLAPNHLSAEFMLRAANNQLAPTLSLRTSLDEIWMAATPLLAGLLAKDPDPKAYHRFTVKKIPDDVIKTMSARLGGLQFRIHPKTRDLKLAITEYAVLMNQLMHQPTTISRSTFEQFLAKKEKVLGEASNLGTDRKVLEEMMH
ncbi:MAG: hypothetical protein NT105_05880 [Verrucomicrobia bacterium]|nr:hypothetical protein [Verrucomicrobiota bacterium]